MNIFSKKLVPVMAGLLLSLTVNAGAAIRDLDIKELTTAVGNLKLGTKEYVIGTRLTPAQKKFAAAHSIADAFPGTIKFRDKGLKVVAEEKNHTVLAMYQEQENASGADIKQMVGELMTRFEEPTTMAHSKIIYWAYGNDGKKIDEETLNKARDSGGEIPILATVKFNSTMEIKPDLQDDGPEKATIYYLITSQPLLQHFVKQ